MLHTAELAAPLTARVHFVDNREWNPQGRKQLWKLVDWSRAQTAARMSDPLAKVSMLASHVALKVAAGELLNVDPHDIQVHHPKNDAPCVSVGQSGVVLFVSLSRTDEWSAIALSTANPVGVDIERDRQLTNPATILQLISAHSDSEKPCSLEVLRKWVRHEAAWKVGGHGLPTWHTTERENVVTSDLVAPNGFIAAVAALNTVL